MYNKLKEINYEENNSDELPFFLDFGDNALENIKKETEGTLEESKKTSRRVIRHYNREEIIKNRGSELDLLLE